MASQTARVARLLALALALVLAGCEHEYVYGPTVHTHAAIAGRPASFYAIPEEAPHGFVEVASLGFADLEAAGASDAQTLRALHIRVVVGNNGDKPWTVDTREQRLELPGEGDSRPLFAKADLGTPPMVIVPAGGKVTLDLFYPLPESMKDAEGLPSFDTIWKVQTDTRLVAERTPFERLEVKAVPTYDYEYWGPPYYYDPYYHGWVGVYVGPGFVGHPVHVHHPHYAPPPGRHRR